MHVDLGVVANTKITGANATHYILSVNNTTRAMQFVNSRLDQTVQDVVITTPVVNQLLTYNTQTQKWYNTDINNLFINADELGGYTPDKYPRKAENAAITAPWAFNANVNFTATVDLNAIGTKFVTGANTTHYIMAANATTRAMYFTNSRLDSTVQDVFIAGPNWNHVLTYNPVNLRWQNTDVNDLFINADELGSYTPDKYPRKAEAAIVTGTWSFSANTLFSARVDLGSISTTLISGANATHYIMAANVTTRAMYFTNSRLDATVQDVAIATPAANHVLAYNTTTLKWQNVEVNTLNIDADFLGTYAPAAYPRKAETAIITGAWAFNGNVVFSGSKDLGAVGTTLLTGANATHYIVAANVTTRAMYFTNSRLDSTVQDVAITSPVANQILTYNTTTLKWQNVDINALGIDADQLGTYAPAAFTRKAENAIVTGAWNFQAPIYTVDNLQNGTTMTSSAKLVGVAANTAVLVDSFSALTYNTAKYLVTAKSASSIHTTEILAVAASGDVDTTEYAQLSTNGHFFTMTANASGDTIRLYMTSTVSANVSIQKTYLT
jgi:hypothetical protein